MSFFSNRIINLIPEKIKPAARYWYDGLRRLPEIPAAYLHPWRAESIWKMRAFKNIHQGKRCFIIGNGPSLKQMDLTLLKNEFTFGMNRIYMAFPEMGYETSFYVCMNDLVVEQCAADIQNLRMPKFISWRGRKWVNIDPDLHFIYSSYTGPRFSPDITGRVWESATVTFVALQLAYYMGFDHVYLIGVDHNFVTQGTPNTTIVSQGDDPNHFNPGYFGKGFRWQLPDLETSEIGYEMAKQAFERDDRRVLDATIGGKLNIFPKVTFTDLFN
jgi:hypothetical protein